MDLAQKPEAKDGGCCGHPVVTTRRVALTTLKPGQQGVVAGGTLDEADAAFLRAMGLQNDAKVRMCRAGEPCIVAVGSIGVECGCTSVCRIGLARPLAERIIVTIDA